MQRDLHLPLLVADTGDELPLGVLTNPSHDADQVYYLNGGFVDEPTFSRAVPPGRRVAILNMATGVAVVYDISQLADLIVEEEEDEEEDEWYAESRWVVTQPAPRVEISDDDERRILERARAAAVAEPSLFVPEPEITTSVVDPTPRCEILPEGSAYDDVYDFTDFDVTRDEFDRDVPPQRRAVIRSGTSTTAYDAEQLVRAVKGVVGNSRAVPSRRAYVLSTRTGSCTLDRNGYVDLLRRAKPTETAQEATQQTSSGAGRAPQAAPALLRPQQPTARQPEARQYQQPSESIIAPARPRVSAEVAAAPSLPFGRLSLRQPAAVAETFPARQAPPMSRMGPSLGAPMASSPTAGGRVRAPVVGGIQSTRLATTAGPPRSTPSTINQRIRDAVSGARDGTLVRFLGSPEFERAMSAPLAIDILADALVQDFVAHQGTGARDSALPIVLASLGVRSYNTPILSETFDAALLTALAQAGALGSAGTLTRAGFAPSDEAIIRAVVYRLSLPGGDTEGATRIIQETPMANPLNYRRVLAAAARVGSLRMARYIAESVLRDNPLSAADALALADIAARANQRAIQSFFLSMAQPASPVPVSADYREREREYRGTP
nr:hypothetical protein [Pandoravirus massiliensis]